jgi:hypothetical protein
MSLSISEDKWFVFYQGFGYGNKITPIHCRIWNKGLINKARCQLCSRNTFDTKRITFDGNKFNACYSCRAYLKAPYEI